MRSSEAILDLPFPNDKLTVTSLENEHTLALIIGDFDLFKRSNDAILDSLVSEDNSLDIKVKAWMLDMPKHLIKTLFGIISQCP